jgi:cellulose synthase/poly-beta-1,6-N-acetylglucosamine synthase-like glycosyltransferase
MSTLILAWVIVVGLGGLVWLSRHREISVAQRTQRLLGSASHAGPPSPEPMLSVLVAAKDEQDNIETCVRTLCEQDYPNFEVIAIDDRSTDRTPDILARLQREFPERLTVLTVQRLREGWFGKNNAMRMGVEASRGRWLCFTDADCRFVSRRTLSMAMAEAAQQGADLLSVLPVLETKTFWERLIQPVCAAVMILWFHPDRVNNPKSRSAYANGAFMLMNREAYDRIGGHASVRTEVNEDMHMARLIKEAGLKLQVIQNDDLYRTRMYSTFGQTWRGWSRIFYGCLGSVRRIGVAWLILSLMSLLPWVGLVAAVTGLTTGSTLNDGAWGALAWVAAVTVLLQTSVMWRFYQLTRANPIYSLAYVFGASLVWGMLVNATMKLGGMTRTTWRGTTYRANQVEPAAGGVLASESRGPDVEEVGAGAP